MIDRVLEVEVFSLHLQSFLNSYSNWNYQNLLTVMVILNANFESKISRSSHIGQSQRLHIGPLLTWLIPTELGVDEPNDIASGIFGILGLSFEQEL